MTLDAAHRGYDYQDLLTAIRLVDVLIGRLQITHVDEKLFDGDLFDDLTAVDLQGNRERFQFKHRDAPTHLPLSTFTSQARDLKLDSILACIIADRSHSAGTVPSRYRIVLRDGSPETQLQPFLRLASPDPGGFSTGFHSSRFQLGLDACWPASASSTPGRRAGDPFAFLRTGSFQRADFELLCRQVVIEVDAPEASFDLTRPGPAEQILLERIRREVGAETYPNADRTAEDVAQILVGMGKAAREKRCDPTSTEALRRTRLRTDFGAVARAHPVDSTREVVRANAVDQVVAAAEGAANARHPLLLVGPPGQGKSWICHQALAALRQAGWLTAEHYCFLGDGDGDRKPRVLTDRIIGSLLARLAAIEPKLVEEQRPRFSADEEALVRAVQQALKESPDRKVALVIDGLDHVTRVQGSVAGRDEPSRVLAQQLASIDLPAGCVLIVLSQPGDQLAPLEAIGAASVQVPALGAPELLEMAEKLGVLATLADPAPTSSDSIALIAAIAGITQGNALYATYVCREVLRQPSLTLDTQALVSMLPPFDGTLHAYYSHLLSTIQDGVVADTLALVDFAITRDDLREIWPASARRIDAEVARLAPVLTELSTQGGIRIYHESFARFLREPLERNDGDRLAILKTLSDWLQSKGFFTDLRAFRFLLPLLEKRGERTDVVRRVESTFLRDAVAHGFPPAAIIANICVALRCAGRLRDWVASCRLVELSRGVEAFEYERVGELLVEFADVALAMIGPHVFPAQLLYDGRTTVPSRAGLELCAAIDRAGLAAPWSEYLAKFEHDSASSNTHYGETSDERVYTARLRGQLRSRFPSPASVPNDFDWSRLSGVLDAKFPARETVDALCETIGATRCLALLERSSNSGRYAVALAAKDAAEIGSAVHDGALALARQSPPSGGLPSLFALGVAPTELPPERTSDISDKLRAAADAVTTDRAELDSADQWIDACALAARMQPATISRAEAWVRGNGWYRSWLRYVAHLSAAEVSTDASTDALSALHLLEENLHPFTGEPRAVDLYPIHARISATIRRGLTLLGDDQWAEGVETVQRVAYGLLASASGESWGPINIDEMLATFVALTTTARRIVTESAIDFSLGRTRGRFYSQIAGLYLLRARCALRCGDQSASRRYWESACELFVAYGWRRDRTIFELLSPFAALTKADQERAQTCLARIHASCLRVLLHTDGKDTRHVLTDWFAELAAADAPAASTMIAHDTLGSCNDVFSRHEDTRVELWKAHFRRVDPFIAGALRTSIATSLEPDDPEALRLLVQHVQADGSSAAAQLLRHVTARLDERPSHYGYSNGEEMLQKDDRVVSEINSILGAAGIAQIMGRTATRSVAHDQERGSTARPASLNDLAKALIVEDFGSGAASISRLLRRLGALHGYDDDMHSADAARLVNALGYRLISMAVAGQRHDVELALHSLADQVRFHVKQPLFVQLAEGLERHGERRLAAIAYVLTWTRSRGHGGWLTFGGETQLASLGRAMTLDRNAALDELSFEIERVVAEGHGSLGVTQALVYAFARLDMGVLAADGVPRISQDVAFRIWGAAADVIISRTPRLTAGDDPQVVLVPTGADTTDKLERALCLALVAGLGHPSREQKRRTLIGISLLIQLRPARMEAALSTAFGRLTEPSTLYWLLWVLREHAAPLLLRALQTGLQRLCASEYLAVRSIAREILTSVDSAQADSIPLPLGDAISALVRSGSFASASTKQRTAAVAGDRIYAVGSDLPGLLDCVASAVIDREEEIRERSHKQARALSSTTDTKLPDAFIATFEVIETELQRVAGRGRVSLAADGRVIADPMHWEAQLALRLANLPDLALMLERTREPRPDIPAPPSNGTPGTMATATASDTPAVAAGPYRGFRAIASMECRHTGHRRTTETSSIRCIALELGIVPDPSGCPPLTSLPVMQWFATVSLPTPVYGALVGHDHGDDEPSSIGLGLCRPILSPHPWIVSALGLTPSGQEFVFNDSNGTALALRTWRAEYEVDDYRLTHPLLTGAQVVLREDLFQRLLAICGDRFVLRDYVAFDAD